MTISKKGSITTGNGLQHRDDYFETPDWLFDYIDEYLPPPLRFDLDLCANDDNSKCHAFIDEEMDVLSRTGDLHWQYHDKNDVIFCNPPRSKNGKFVNFVHDILWEKWNLNVVMLLCWNDLGNGYGKKIFDKILSGEIKVIQNLGKVKFYKNGKESEFVSRLTYFSCWFKAK